MTQVNGWDERDYRLSSQIHCLPSYGLLSNGDRMISRDEVISIIKNFAKQRFEAASPAPPKGER